MGLALGTASLIKNIMAGTFNSINKFTGSLSTGIAHLCMVIDCFIKQEFNKYLNRMKTS